MGAETVLCHRGEDVKFYQIRTSDGSIGWIKQQFIRFERRQENKLDATPDDGEGKLLEVLREFFEETTSHISQPDGMDFDMLLGDILKGDALLVKLLELVRFDDAAETKWADRLEREPEVRAFVLRLSRPHWGNMTPPQLLAAVVDLSPKYVSPEGVRMWKQFQQDVGY